MNLKEIDQKALETVKNYKKEEAKLLDIIGKVDRFKVYRSFGYNSLFQYCVQRLQLSESQTSGFITVARKSQEVPLIKKSIEKGTLTVSKAKRITSVITTDNQDHWIELASTSTQKKVEREVALAQPEKMITEKTTYINPLIPIGEKVSLKQNCPKIKLELGLSEKTMIQLRRAQDILSQKKKQPVNLEKTLEALLETYLLKYDPVEKAKRQESRGKLNKNSKATQKQHSLRNAEKVGPSNNKIVNTRPALPAQLKHSIYLKAGGQCMAKNPNGERCEQRRFLEIHHTQPLSQGGRNHIDNLTLLCSGHHSVCH